MVGGLSLVRCRHLPIAAAYNIMLFLLLLSGCQVSAGLLSEALMLLDLGMIPNSHIATKAIGYRQACAFLQVSQPCLAVHWIS